jgi:hypothetical protein
MTGHPRLLPARLLPGHLLGRAAPTTTTPPEPIYTLGRIGQPSTVPTLVIADFDNSGSVTSPSGTDPLSNRFAEVDRAFFTVAKKGARHELGAVLHFDTPSSGEVEPVPITRSGMAQLRRGLSVPSDGAGSSWLGPSLRRAEQLASAHPGHDVTLVVLSDFYLLDADRPAVMAELAAFPGTVHAVVLGGHKVTDMPAQVSVTNIGRDDPPGAVAKALFASLTRHRPGSRAFRESNPKGPPTPPALPRP